ncbi:hypothetical protein AK812_SmicGene30308 [Symbiodinium microadriaticum]|uniref:C3H1-type domain-containing protein n=1 Tax=Symbiodinium microadriaticum TaxID=2951 RepID=A0A1Q9CZK7_SYMMI|nr:hypothetical protein AK812_SmicGene30308 [Symbiodinium microadriaticum]
MDDFVAKLAPQLLANLPVAYGRGWPSGAPIDPKQPLTLKLREMRSGVERPVQFDVAGEVLTGDLRRVAHRRFPVVLARREVKLYVMGQLLQDDMQPLFNVRGIYDGATVNFMPGQHSAESKVLAISFCVLASLENHNDLRFSDLEDLDTDDGEGLEDILLQVSPDSTSSKALGDDVFGKQLSTGSQTSQPTRLTSNSSAKKVCPDVRMVSEKRQRASKDGKKSTETMPRVSKTCPLLLDNWSPDPEWAMPSSKEKAKVPKGLLLEGIMDSPLATDTRPSTAESAPRADGETKEASAKPQFRKMRTGATELPDDFDDSVGVLFDSDDDDTGPMAFRTTSLRSRASRASAGSSLLEPLPDEDGITSPLSALSTAEPWKVVPSLGSDQHGTGLCKPCLWFWKPQGCQKGHSCSYCHLCPQNEFTVRKKLTARALKGSPELADSLPFYRPPPGLEAEVEVEAEEARQASIGEVLHASGMCRPCASFWKGRCSRGEDCFHCHVCLTDDAKRKRRPKQAREALATGPTTDGLLCECRRGKRRRQTSAESYSRVGSRRVDKGG